MLPDLPQCAQMLCSVVTLFFHYLVIWFVVLVVKRLQEVPGTASLQLPCEHNNNNLHFKKKPRSTHSFDNGTDFKPK